MNKILGVNIITSLLILFIAGKLISSCEYCRCKKPKKLYPIIELKNDSSDLSKNLDLFNKLLDWYKNKKIRAMLHTIAITEGTMPHNILDKSDFNLDKIPTDQYKICFLKIMFDSFDKHPGIINETITSAGIKLASSAAGRYQFLLKTWTEFLRILNLNEFPKKYVAKLNQIHKKNLLFIEKSKELYKNSDDLHKISFGPFLQDLGAIYLLYKAGAIPLILKEDIESVLPRISPIWASIPEDRCNISYFSGQPAFQFDFILNIYKKIYNKLNKKPHKISGDIS